MAVNVTSPTQSRFHPIQITLGVFIRFDSADGHRQIDVVEERRTPPDYDLLRDFYATLRNRIRRLASEQNLQGRALFAFSQEIGDDVKQERFTKVAKGFAHFERRHKPKIVGTVPKALWSDAGIRVTVDPEVVFAIGDQRFITKIYLGKDELESSRLIASLQMMRECYDRPGYRVAILDCDRGTLHRDTRLDRRRSYILLRTTAAKFVGIWRALDEGVLPAAVVSAR